MNLLDRAKQFAEGAKVLTDWLGSGGETVSVQLAQQRANVCLKCPMNKLGGAITDTIATAIKKQLEIKSKLNLRVAGEKSLLACEGCGCVLKLKIWLPTHRLGLDENELEKFHPDCWMKSEFEAQKPK